ncbi:MAG: ABC transporter ATP-binding protein [Chloroflexi bacterium]|nr:MAG: ABC transporter ATP-binding protein [Chloroflexota bacterium]
MEAPILSLKNVSVLFGGVRAVGGVNLDIPRGSLVGLIGPNGAGKTTIFNLITGSVKPTTGEILFKGRSIVGLSMDRLCHLGISRTFQNIRLFPRMTVFENVALGLHSQPHYSLLEAFVRTPRARQSEREVAVRVGELLEMVELADMAGKVAGSLPYGLQRKLELARAMATSPELLLLDEPAARMNEDECADLIAMIDRIHGAMGYSIVLIEHHMHVVMELCRSSTIFVLNLGEILAHGTPEAIQNDEEVIAAYLGVKKRNGNRPVLP